MRYGIAARVEDKSLDVAQAVVHRVFDWLPRVEAYTGLGTPTRVRVLCRTLLSPGERHRHQARPTSRGFRSYLCLPADEEQVRLAVGGRTLTTVTDRAGYIDQEVDLLEPLTPGWHSVHFTAVRSGAMARGALLVVDPAATIGLISDIDDTAMVTAVPQLALAVWNTFIEKTTSRKPVIGMPDFLNSIVADYPNAPVVYLSNGAWNTARALRRFLKRFNFPAGPLLLTDFGPTDTGLFRSGKAHKRSQIKWLMEAFPHIGWVLVGDDGQSDPAIYAEAAQLYPSRVAAIAIRTLTPVQRMVWLAGTRPAPLGATTADDVPVIAGPNGDALLAEFRALNLIF